MTFARYFRLSSYGLIGSGFLAIAATGALDPTSVIAFSCALISSWFIDTARLNRLASGWILNTLAIVYFPIYLIDYRLLSHSFMISTIHLILFAGALKLMTLTRDRDYVYLYIISFAGLLAAATLTVDMVFALSFLLFLLSGLSTMVLFEMRRSNAAALRNGQLRLPVPVSASEDAGLELFSRFPASKVAGLSLVMTVVIIILAVPLFFLLPRAKLGILGRPSARQQFVSGFSEMVELGEIGNIKESDTVVMRVKVSEPPSKLPRDLKWRGIALDYFNGRAWSRSDLRRQSVRLQESRFFKLEEFINSPDLLTQTYFLESLSTDVIFASRRVLAVSLDLGHVQRDSYDSLYSSGHSLHKVRYVAVSDPWRPDAEMLNSRDGTVPEGIRARFLQLPPEDPRIGKLAGTIAAAHATPYEKARAIESYLLGNYSYSLQLRGTPKRKDPLAMFLFEVRKGHCEYFASAMTIMLREIGIPARLVNGFRTGEYNSIGDDWTIRQYDAHSWVEAYLAPFGWQEFDPTPPDPRRTRPGFERVLANVVDALDLWWWEEVVNYDFLKQYMLVDSIRTRLAGYQQSLQELLVHSSRGSRSLISGIQVSKGTLGRKFRILAMLTAAVAGAIILLRRHATFRRRVTRILRRLVAEEEDNKAITTVYAESLHLLDLHGFSRDRSQTPLEFVQSLRGHPAAEPFEALTRVYNRVRFGSIGVEAGIADAESLLRSLRNCF